MSNNDILIRPLEMQDASAILDLKLRNRDFYQTFEPIRDESHFTLDGQEQDIKNGIQAADNDQSYIFAIVLQETNEVVGRIALTGVSRGPFQNAYLGYYIDQSHNGKGFATAAVSLCLQYAFKELGLHRVEAGVMPRNLASKRVLEKSGFSRVGLAKTYLKINGAWEDHEIFASITDQDYS